LDSRKSLIKNSGKILIIKPSSLGDVVHSLPFLNAMRLCFPKAEIHWVIAEGFEGLLEGHPMIDRLWIINKDDWKRIKQAKETIHEVRMLLKRLKKERFDMVIDLQGLFRSGIMTAATRSAVRIGFSEAREGSRFFYTNKVKGGKEIHAVDRYLKIAKWLGCDTAEVIFPFPLYKSSSSQFLLLEDYAVFVPGARWKTKKWPAEKFGKLAALMNGKVIVVGSKADSNTADEIVARSQGKAISFAGKTDLKELIEIMRGAQFVVSNDSGPMHIAAALGIPVFAIFGPTDPLKTGPYGKGHTTIQAELPCIRCFRKKCDDMKCMEHISVGKVFETIKLGLSLSPLLQ
jgi:lipopolysaccharide heptosyltransferase I